ncbi:MAG: 2-phospho-L-lactate guanylyltransferase [Gammaproteobacteria bacterium]
MWVVIPVKPFAYAKQRLAGVLTDVERSELARVMLTDLLTTLGRCPGVSGTLLVSQEESLPALARPFGAECLHEEARGLSRAVAQAATHLAARGETRLLMLPGDVPLATAEEIGTLVARHAASPLLTIVADREGVGTNALAVSPPGLMSFYFGRESFQAHCAAAAAAGAVVQVLALPGIAFDIDTPDDLRDLMTYDTDAETLAYLCDRGLPPRVLPRQQVQSAW